MAPGGTLVVGLRNNATQARAFTLAVVDEGMHQQAAGLHARQDPADGHFLGGIFYENYRQMGRITGDTFFYDGKDADGQLSFRDGIAGNFRGLKLELRGGMVFLDLVEVV